VDIIATLLIAFLTAIIGYFIGTIQERNSIKWKENREAIQCAFACVHVQLYLAKDREKVYSELAKKWSDLKYNKIFNIINKKIYKELSEVLELPFYDPIIHEYDEQGANQFISRAEKILPILKKELE
jgi:hypothetical protein